MYVQATISCECGCIFESEFQKSKIDCPPKCPQCDKIMDQASWETLRDIMAGYGDFSHHVMKWHLERNKPLMQVPAITVRTLRD